MTPWLSDAAITFAASLVPGLELRAGIPVGIALGLPVSFAVIISVFGNCLQIGAALRLVDLAYRHAGRFPKVARWLKKTEDQTLRHKQLIHRFGWIGLVLFVLLPLPGTGAWGGAVLARFLQLSAGGVWLGLSLGIALSGVLVGAGMKGALTIYSLL